MKVETAKGLGVRHSVDAQRGEARTNSSVLGDIVFLLLHSNMHRMWPVMMLERNILPPIHHKQFRLYHDDKGRPIGFVSWAWLSDEIDQKYATGTYALKPDDWISGKSAWIIDFVTPFGHGNAVRKHMRAERLFFPTGVCKAFRKVKGEDAIRVMQFGPADAWKDRSWKSYKRPIVKPTIRKIEG